MLFLRLPKSTAGGAPKCFGGFDDRLKRALYGARVILGMKQFYEYRTLFFHQSGMRHSPEGIQTRG